MTMVSSGPISLGGTATTGGLNQSINVELGYSGTAQISLNDTAVRTLLGKASGAISLNDAYGKSNQFSFSIAGATDANLRSLAVAAGWNQTSKVVATVTAAIYSTSTGTPALTINGSFPNGVELINQSTIAGKGGAGGTGGSYSFGNPYAGLTGGSGGLALSVSVAVTINNGSGTIGGGGGGGGGGGMCSVFKSGDGGGGGGGGGSGYGAGGAGGTANQGNGSAGSAGGLSSGGAGGLGALISAFRGGTGGTGGSLGSSGAGGDAGYGYSNASSGGAAGACITGNSNITWSAFGTRLGSIS